MKYTKCLKLMLYQAIPLHTVPLLNVETRKVLLQVFLDHKERCFFGFTQSSDDERQSISQRFRLCCSFLKHHPIYRHDHYKQSQRKKITVDTAYQSKRTQGSHFQTSQLEKPKSQPLYPVRLVRFNQSALAADDEIGQRQLKSTLIY